MNKHLEWTRIVQLARTIADRSRDKRYPLLHSLAHTLTKHLFNSRVSTPRGSLSSWQRRWRYFYCRLQRLKGDPTFLARGLAAGVFAGCFPLFGLQTLIGIALAILCRGSKLLAAAGTWISNPITYGPIFFLNFEVGQLLLGSSEVFEIERVQSASALLEVGADFLLALFLGCFVVGVAAAVVSYIVGLWLFRRWRDPHLSWHQPDSNSRRSPEIR